MEFHIHYKKSFIGINVALNKNISKKLPVALSFVRIFSDIVIFDDLLAERSDE